MGAEHKPGVWWDGVSCLEFPAGNGARAEVAVGFVFVRPVVDREPDGMVTASLKEGVKQCLPTTSVGWSS